MNQILRVLALIVIGSSVSLMSSCTSMNRPNINIGRKGFSGQFGLNKRSDPVRHVQGGASMTLTYDPQSRSIKGLVENTTNRTLKRVRVKARLSNGVKLGPTRAIDLAPGETRKIEFIQIAGDFTGWTAHVEVGGSED